MFKERSFNLGVARACVLISRRRPMDWNYGSGYAQAESMAAGGKEFQHHRNLKSPVYAANCLPTEHGYRSVALTCACSTSIGSTPDTLTWPYGCCEDSECPVAYDSKLVKSVSQMKEGALFVYADGKLELRSPTNTHEVIFGGIDNISALLGVATIEGHNIAFTCDTLYMSSAENSFDFTPSLRTGAGSFGIAASIGSIVNVIPNGRAIYVLGTKGGAYGQCTQDIQTPLIFTPIIDFIGIESKECCTVDYNTSSFYAWTKSGLQEVQEARAINVLPDISDALHEGRYVNLHELDTLTGEAPYDITHNNRLNARDKVLCKYSTLYTEDVVEARVKVRNLSPRYATISWADFTRMLVIDRTLDRFSILHFPHLCTLAEDSDLYLLGADGRVFKIVQGGVGFLHFAEISGTQRKAVKMPLCRMLGDFDIAQYPTPDTCSNSSGLLSSMLLEYGQDFRRSNNLHSMKLSAFSHREVQYSGLAIGQRISINLKFCGHIVEFITRN